MTSKKMPRKPSGNRPPNKTKARLNAKPISKAASSAARKEQEVQARVQAVTAGLEKLQGAAHRTHLRADAVHQSARATHLRVNQMPADLPEDRGGVEIEEPSNDSQQPFPIAAVGASAGGYEAFVELVSTLPKQSGIAFVLVQHLDPHHKSKLSELLTRSTSLPVLEVKDGMKIKPDHIYVMPENTTMTIAGARLSLAARKDRDRPPLPIDHFLRSLARSQQNRAIAIILSGTGSDGTLGVKDIKSEGGITFAQSEDTAKFFGMPGSAIASEGVDFVLPPREMAKALARMAQHPYLGRVPSGARATAVAEPGQMEKLLHESGKELQQLFILLRLRTGVDFSFYKQSTLKRRILRRMILHQLGALRQYVRLLEGNPAEVDALFNDLLINVTHFFRDPQTFQTLKRKVFPRLLKSHLHDTPWRFWVCGCATGEEAYSLAIILVEFFEEKAAHRPVQIFATDISETSIERARAGVYPENIAQDVSPARLRRFFSKSNGGYQINKSIRDMCVFARQNVLSDPPFSNLDLVSCRNVLIYFGPILQRKIIPLFHYSLQSGGFLLLGSSETIGASSDYFSLWDKRHKIYNKKANFLRVNFDVHQKVPSGLPRDPRSAQPAVSLQSRTEELHQQVDKILLREFSPAAVVVNSDLEVVHFRGSTSDYLEHPPGSASLNLLKMARESLGFNLRTALSRAVKQDHPVKQSGIELFPADRNRLVSIQVVPFRLQAHERFFLVVFREHVGTALETQRSAKLSRETISSRDRREVARLRQELATTKESLQAIIEEQEANNEELKSANEEIQSSNEELQSTNEELETAKEELQSTNEELSTLNEELQNRNQELGQLNNDLNNLLTSVNVAIIMLAEDLTIRRFTPMAERMFNLISADVGRRLSDLNRAIIVPDLDQSVHSVITNLTPIEREVQDHNGRWFSLRIRPYRTRENQISGAVILLLDIDNLKRALDLVISTAREPLLTLGRDLLVRHANDAFYKMFRLTPADIKGKFIYELAQGQWNIPELRSLLEKVLPSDKQVDNYEVKAEFPGIGLRRLLLNARRFHDEAMGTQVILLAISDATNHD